MQDTSDHHLLQGDKKSEVSRHSQAPNAFNSSSDVVWPRRGSSQSTSLDYTDGDAKLENLAVSAAFLENISILRKNAQNVGVVPSTIQDNIHEVLSATSREKLENSSDTKLPIMISPVRLILPEYDDQNIPFEKAQDAQDIQDPTLLGQFLFSEQAPNFSRSMVCPIIGKNDAFHKTVLVSYLNCFDFSNVSLDEAFRRFCRHLQLSGETQAIDRILYQMSLRFWNCNQEAQKNYITIDIVYGTLFSIVLLNTDLNTVNVGTKNNKRMTQKMFLRNTMSLIDQMIQNDETVKKHFGSSTTHYENLKIWRREFETILKEIYQSVEANPILQQSQSQSAHILPQTTTMTTSTRMRSLSNQKVINFGASLNMFLKKKDTTSSKQSQPNTMSAVLEGVLIRKHIIADEGERATSRRWIKNWYAIRISKEHGAELIVYKLVHFMTDKDFNESEMNVPPMYSDSIRYEDPTSSTAIPSSIPKSPSESPHIAAENSYILSVGKRYNSSPTSGDSSTGSPSTPPLLDSSKQIPSTTSPSSSTTNPTHHLVLASPTQEYKISTTHDPESISLIHAFASVYHYDDLRRDHCFALHLANNHVYLFQAPCLASQQAWLTTINYWAAVKSREPMRGGVSNLDFGWNPAAPVNQDSIKVATESKRTVSRTELFKSQSLVEKKSSTETAAVAPKLEKRFPSKLGNELSLTSGKSMSLDNLAQDLDSISLKDQKVSTRARLISKWTMDIVSTRLVSLKDEEEQMECMNRQLAYVKNEIETFEALRAKINVELAQHPQLSLAQTNVTRKLDALVVEMTKYETYLNSLGEVINSKGDPVVISGDS